MVLMENRLQPFLHPRPHGQLASFLPGVPAFPADEGGKPELAAEMLQCKVIGELLPSRPHPVDDIHS
jgi:hypothetical protein